MAFLLGGTSVRACSSSVEQDRRLEQQQQQHQQPQHQQQPEPVVIEEDPPELEEMVPLGNGVRCRKQYFDALMAESDSHSDWAAALLKGVFGKDACKMRARPRLPTNKKFPVNFLDIAKFLHRKWLQKQCVYEGGVPVRKHSDAEVEKYVAGLPGYLSDRAEALMGPRGSRRGPSSATASSESGQVPVRVRRPRRPYKRRGSVTPVERPPSYNPPQHPPPPPQEPQRPLNYAWHQGM